jgi:NADPH-dependent glutamate synthase beta subunit-like oxidoreductase
MDDLVYVEGCGETLQRLHKTNNFPEFTGRVCPAPAKVPAFSVSAVTGD